MRRGEERYGEVSHRWSTLGSLRCRAKCRAQCSPRGLGSGLIRVLGVLTTATCSSSDALTTSTVPDSAKFLDYLAAVSTLEIVFALDAIAATLLQYPIFKSRTAHAPSDTLSVSSESASLMHRSLSSGAKIKFPISNST